MVAELEILTIKAEAVVVAAEVEVEVEVDAALAHQDPKKPQILPLRTSPPSPAPLEMLPLPSVQLLRPTPSRLSLPQLYVSLPAPPSRSPLQ